MSEILEPLILDFLEWVAREPRPHADVMDVWRTSCPRLTVWEDAIDRGLVERKAMERTQYIRLTPKGAALLRTHGRKAPAEGTATASAPH